MEKLINKGFNVYFTHTNILYISWQISSNDGSSRSDTNANTSIFTNNKNKFNLPYQQNPMINYSNNYSNNHNNSNGDNSSSDNSDSSSDNKKILRLHTNQDATYEPGNESDCGNQWIIKILEFMGTIG